MCLVAYNSARGRDLDKTRYSYSYPCQCRILEVPATMLRSGQTFFDHASGHMGGYGDEKVEWDRRREKTCSLHYHREKPTISRHALSYRLAQIFVAGSYLP